MKDPYLEQDELIARELFHYWQADWNGMAGYWWQKHRSDSNDRMSAEFGYAPCVTRSNGLPRFSECLEAAYRMEQEIKEQGTVEAYIDNLMEIIGKTEISYITYTGTFLLMHASPQQRAEACYRVLKEKGGI